MEKEYLEVQLVVFKLQQQEYGVQIKHVREIINVFDITPLPEKSSAVEGVINLRGQIIPIIDLKKRLGFKRHAYSSDSRVVVVEIDKQLLGMRVDEAVEVIGLPAEAIQTLPNVFSKGENSTLVVGVGKLDDRLLLILDLSKISSGPEIRQIKAIFEEAKAQKVHAGKE